MHRLLICCLYPSLPSNPIQNSGYQIVRSLLACAPALDVDVVVAAGAAVAVAVVVVVADVDATVVVVVVVVVAADDVAAAVVVAVVVPAVVALVVVALHSIQLRGQLPDGTHAKSPGHVILEVFVHKLPSLCDGTDCQASTILFELNLNMPLLYRV